MAIPGNKKEYVPWDERKRKAETQAPTPKEETQSIAAKFGDILQKKHKIISPYSKLQLREQIYEESRAMAEYALARGTKVTASTVKTIESFEIHKKGAEDQGDTVTIRHDIDLEPLVSVHEYLTTLVEPATPRTILLLDKEQEVSGFWKFLGPVSMIRQMMLAAAISLFLFIFIGLSADVNSNITKGNESIQTILDLNGQILLMNLLFFLAAAGLGASFAALYKANSYITRGTFDPTYQASYWIRFFLGLIAGLILSILISEDAFEKIAEQTGFLAKGIMRPLLAMLGGFSADLFYTIMNRLVETFESLFSGSASERIEGERQKNKSLVANEKSQTQMKMAGKLMKIQQEMSGDMSPEKIQEKLNKLVGELVPSDARDSAQS